MYIYMYIYICMYIFMYIMYMLRLENGSPFFLVLQNNVGNIFGKSMNDMDDDSDITPSAFFQEDLNLSF